MDRSNWERAALPNSDQLKPLAIPTKRGCQRCNRAAELLDVSSSGTALYLCPERHETLVDVSKAMRSP